MVYGYIRVSTEKQTLENQKIEIRRYCKERRLRNIKWIAETVSGTKKPEKRKLGKLLEEAKKDDIVVIAEISRLGRSMLMILDVVQSFLEKGVQVRAIKEGYELGDNIQSKVIAFAFGLSAEIERQLISERTKAGLLRAVKNGKHIGRPKGVFTGKYKLCGKGGFIRRERKKGKTKAEIARELCVSWITLNRYMKKRRII
ncbi:MAG: recombinase family protein [Treponema sp.]|uniref:recombinase family protein n=1 Tax=Treponema sp. TaxID=166 RepID=UPI0025E50B26|nr:recombinase family protein [Treponema sp.]MBR0495763.1 recombinase family protein [Treponema sp.]